MSQTSRRKWTAVFGTLMALSVSAGCSSPIDKAQKSFQKSLAPGASLPISECGALRVETSSFEFPKASSLDQGDELSVQLEVHGSVSGKIQLPQGKGEVSVSYNGYETVRFERKGDALVPDKGLLPIFQELLPMVCEVEMSQKTEAEAAEAGPSSSETWRFRINKTTDLPWTNLEVGIEPSDSSRKPRTLVFQKNKKGKYACKSMECQGLKAGAF